jgi:glycine/D-amino acid oxidase-like deaminating enzyme
MNRRIEFTPQAWYPRLKRASGRNVVTKSKDLRTGRSVWESGRASPVSHRRLTRDIETDVLVVGAGITGATVADALSADGFKVAIVDRRGPAEGASAASTALVQYELDVPLTKLSRIIGKQDAIRAWRRSRLAVDTLAVRLKELGVRDVVRRDTLYLAGNLLDAGGLQREREARLAAGFASRLIGRRELRADFGIRAPAAIMGYADLVLDPRETTRALLRAACEQGARIYSPVDIASIDAGKSCVIATAANGQKIRSHHLVLATGYEFPRNVPQRGHKIVSTWAIATLRQPRKLWPDQCMIWEASDPYLYVRTTSDGRVICGGEDEAFSDEAKRDALLAPKSATLQRKLKKLLPGIDTRTDFAWTGSFGASASGLPTIGPIPRMPNCWAALGYGGNGTTYARIAADVIAGALAGRPDADADLYGFSRRR